MEPYSIKLTEGSVTNIRSFRTGSEAEKEKHCPPISGKEIRPLSDMNTGRKKLGENFESER